MKISKKIISIILTAMLVIAMVPGAAFAEGEEGVQMTLDFGDGNTGILDNDGVLTVSGKGELNITSNIRGELAGTMYFNSLVVEEGITSIGSKAFSGLDVFTNVSLPSTLVTIGDGAFQNCRGMKEVVIPDSVTTVSDSAFEGCTGLEKVKLSKKLLTIGSSAFLQCSSLEGVEVPEGVTWIGSSAFTSCTNLRYIIVPDSIKDVSYTGGFGDGDSGSLIQNNPDLCVVCGENSWIRTNDIYKKQSVNKGKLYVENAGPEMIYSYEPVSGTLTISGKGGFTAGYKFRFASMVKKIEFKDYTDKTFSLYESKPGKDYQYKKLEEITIPDCVTELGDYAFFGCSSLKEVKIGKQVKKIGEDALTGTKNITIVCDKGSEAEKVAESKGIKTIEPSEAEKAKENATTETTDKKTTDKKTTDKKSTDKTTNTTTEKTTTKTATTEKSDSTTTVKKSQLKKGKVVTVKKTKLKYKITKVTKKNGKVKGGTVTLTKSLNKKCKKITVPKVVKIAGVKFKVTAIGNNAFKNCKKLKTITIKSTTIKKVGKNAIKGINKKAVIKVPKSKKKAYKKLFKSKTGFKKTMKLK